MAALGTRALVFEAATEAAPSTFVDYTAAVSNVRFVPAESDTDFVTFADAAAGGAREYTLALTMVQDLASTSLWMKTYAETGDDVPVKVWPNGKPVGGTPTTTQPVVTATVQVTEPDGDWLGGEADASVTQRFTTEVEWKCTAKPVIDDGS
jgi:hypothetical protein